MTLPASESPEIRQSSPGTTGQAPGIPDTRQCGSPTLERAAREPFSAAFQHDVFPDAEALSILQDIAHDMHSEGWDRSARWVEWAARQLKEQRDLKLRNYGAWEKAQSEVERLQEERDALDLECDQLASAKQELERQVRGLRVSLEILGQERDEAREERDRALERLLRASIDINVKTDALNAEIRAKQALRWELERAQGKPQPAPDPIPERKPGETGDLCSICRHYHGNEIQHACE